VNEGNKYGLLDNKLQQCQFVKRYHIYGCFLSGFKVSAATSEFQLTYKRKLLKGVKFGRVFAHFETFNDFLFKTTVSSLEYLKSWKYQKKIYCKSNLEFLAFNAFLLLSFSISIL
jgi:hypothetical protein